MKQNKQLRKINQRVDKWQVFNERDLDIKSDITNDDVIVDLEHAATLLKPPSFKHQSVKKIHNFMDLHGIPAAVSDSFRLYQGSEKILAVKRR